MTETLGSQAYKVKARMQGCKDARLENADSHLIMMTYEREEVPL